MNTTEPDPPPDETPAQALARIADRARQLIDNPTPSTEIVPVGHGAEAAKRQMASEHAELLRTQRDLRAAEKTMRDQIEAVRRSMEAEMYAQLKALEPLQKRVAQLKEGIWTVNLYLGRDETIVPLRGGEPAPAETPISIRQMVLSMDEETALDALNGGIDFTDIEKFDEWLLADPAHLDQVLPEQRGVVVLVPRRRGHDYGNAFENAAKNKANTKSYWLIRNGERLFRMDTETELETGGGAYVVGETILPTRAEFRDLFWRRKHSWETGEDERVPMEPGSDAWLKAEQQQGQRQRHYMRSALILQGLIDRTSVFEPLPAYHVSTINDASYEAGHVVLINDAEEGTQLTTGREPFYEYLARLNKQLRVGMRIVGAFDGVSWRRMRSRDGYSSDMHERLYPHRAEDPQALTIHYLDGRKDDGFVFHYERNQGVYDPNVFVENPNRPGWGRYGTERKAKRRASAVVKPEDKFVIPFDLVDVDTLRTYMQARLERHAYLDLFPLFEAVIEMKEAEAKAEAPMRELLTGALVAAGIDREDAEQEMPSLVDWWKLTNRYHRPLVSLDHEAEAKAVKAIVTEYKRRQKAVSDADRDADMIQRLRGTHGDDALLIAQTRDGRWVLFTRQRHTLSPKSIPEDTFVTQHTYTRSGQPKAVDEWVLPGVRANKWRIVWQHDDWTDWKIDATPSTVLSGPEVEQMAREAAAELTRLAAEQGTWQPQQYQPGPKQPMPGKLMAVQYEHDGGRHLRHRGRMYSYLLPDEPSDDRYGRGLLLRLETFWKRTVGGQLQITHEDRLDRAEVRYHGGWHEADPTVRETMPQREGLILWDLDVMDRLDRLHAERKAQQDEASALWHRLWVAEKSVMTGWLERREAAEFDRFLEDYQDASLWEEHRRRLTIKYPHQTSHQNWDTGLMKMLRRLHEAGSILDGYTVAELAELDRGRGGDYTPPEDIADIVVVDRPDSEED